MSKPRKKTKPTKVYPTNELMRLLKQFSPAEYKTSMETLQMSGITRESPQQVSGLIVRL
jgi:ribosomal protein L1